MRPLGGRPLRRVGDRPCEHRDADEACSELGAPAQAERRLERGEEPAEVQAAGERARAGDVLSLEAAGEGPPRAEDQRFHRRLAELELLGDLLVGEAAPLAEEDRLALELAQVAEGGLERESVLTLGRRCRRHRLELLGVLDELEPAAAAVRVPGREADVVGDLQEPGDLGLGDDATLEPAAGVEKGRLECVLGLLLRVKPTAAVRQHALAVALVETLRCGLNGHDLGISLGGLTHDVIWPERFLPSVTVPRPTVVESHSNE